MIQDAQQPDFKVDRGREGLKLIIAIHALRAQGLHRNRVRFCEFVQPFQYQALGQRWPFHVAPHH